MNTGENNKLVLVVDDETNMRHMLTAMLLKEGYAVEDAGDAMQALKLIQKKRYDFILCDVKMPEITGLEFLLRGQSDLEQSTVIMMSAYGSVEMALDAMKAGAYDFISKPFKIDEVVLTLKKAEERELLRSENRKLRNQLKEISDQNSFENIVGESRAIGNVIHLARKIARYDTTVLITGASGTGKELFARGIHYASSARDKRFYAINCGSIPGELLESELFGYVKGAFTGADSDRKGILEVAEGSTLFLDEIGDMPLLMQVKLLRVLQENEICPLGTSIPRKINVRILAATSKNLETEVTEGKFREDLYYRLNVLSLKLPTLQERIDDLPILCHHFIQKYNDKFGTNVGELKQETLSKLFKYAWPGNVRELENVIQRGVVLAENDCFDESAIPGKVAETDRFLSYSSGDCGFSLKKIQKKIEAEMIYMAMVEAGGNKSKASQLLEISYPSLLSKIKTYKINEDKLSEVRKK